MNSNNKMPFKKRANPFETESSPVQKEENKPVSTVESKVEPLRDPFANSKSKLMDLDDEPVVEIKKEEPKQQPVVQEKPVQKKQVIKEDDPNREKYTATMDRSLRIRVKKAAIDLGLQVSSFIEEACREKLEREGK